MTVARATIRTEAGVLGGQTVEASVEYMLDGESDPADVGLEAGRLLWRFVMGLAAGMSEEAHE